MQKRATYRQKCYREDNYQALKKSQSIHFVQEVFSETDCQTSMLASIKNFFRVPRLTVGFASEQEGPTLVLRAGKAG